MNSRDRTEVESSRIVTRRQVLGGLLAVLPASVAAECGGYHKVDLDGTLPKGIETLAIPTFRNPSLRYRVEQRFTDAVTREVLRRARRLRITSDQQNADAILTGEIKDMRSSGALLDDTGRTRMFEVVVVAAITLRTNKPPKVVFDNQRMVFRGEFELSDDPESFFNEEDPAVDRIAKAFATSVVSTILEGGF
jgi:hypothetical protein